MTGRVNVDWCDPHAVRDVATPVNLSVMDVTAGQLGQRMQPIAWEAD